MTRPRPPLLLFSCQQEKGTASKKKVQRERHERGRNGRLVRGLVVGVGGGGLHSQGGLQSHDGGWCVWALGAGVLKTKKTYGQV